MGGHTIVCGGDALAMRIAEELTAAGMTVVPLQDPKGLAAAGIQHADAVVCVDDDDAVNLEMALLARQANSGVRVVARLTNTVLREAMGQDNGPGAILDVADLAAPAVVEACLARTTHTISAAGIDFVVSGTDAPGAATLREMYGDLAPVAVIYGESSDDPGGVVVCPGRDFAVNEGDWTAMIGTAEELAAQGIAVPKPLPRARTRRSPARRLVDAVRMLRDDINPMFYRALAVSATLLICSTVLLRLAYRNPRGMTWIDALYFSTETIATVGYGDFSFVEQPTWLRVWGIALMFAGVTTTAILVAFIADVLLSRRLAQSAGRRQVRHLRHHVVVVGLGSFGIRVAGDLTAEGYDVVAIERNEDNRYLAAARELGVPVIFGDATLRQTLEAARVQEARAVAVLTQDDMVNIEAGIMLHEMLAAKEEHVPIVLRVYDRVLGAAVAQRFKFDDVRSTVELAAPYFIGAALGLQVFGTFSVGQRSFMVGGVDVTLGSDLDGMRMADIPMRTRVIAITRPGTAPQLHPRRGARLSAGDTAYLVGPYRELLDALRKGQRATRG
ncbi:TrkA family potassium uptake protein [Mycobacterium sp. 1274761.0]|uniref:potassium channel family protein n=1 Tax=Mycobacterium sp. 1274761.0 TaxID=1834077 RepID=UPI000800A1EA|nr:NAD-binding protein [Mycobacterium sp. 1274761.0]OBK74923.1 potassium transporter TrkA [Mycobacterium sp. 1274761.0]